MPKIKACTEPQRPFRLYTVTETAEQLSSSEKTVRRLIERGELRVRRIGRSVRIAHEDLAGFLAQAA